MSVLYREAVLYSEVKFKHTISIRVGHYECMYVRTYVCMYVCTYVYSGSSVLWLAECRFLPAQSSPAVNQETRPLHGPQEPEFGSEPEQEREWDRDRG